LSVGLAACRSAVEEEEVTTTEPILRIYPNPGQDFFHVDAAGIAQGTRLSVSDILGKEVLRKELMEGDNQISLDKVPAGAYFFRMQGPNVNKIMKVIRQ
jgi:hypothetical protein